MNNMERDGDMGHDGHGSSDEEFDDEQDTQDVLDAEALLRERRPSGNGIGEHAG